MRDRDAATGRFTSEKLPRLLTPAEKRAFRTMPCGKCHKRPPYPDGSWTQKHRLTPGSRGGKYTEGNTVPRCPECHAKEPGHDGRLIMLPQAKRREGGRKSGFNVTRIWKGRHLRWHRGNTHPKCPYCEGLGEPNANSTRVLVDPRREATRWHQRGA